MGSPSGPGGCRPSAPPCRLIVRLHQRPGRRPHRKPPAPSPPPAERSWDRRRGVVSAELADHQPLNPGRQLDIDLYGDSVGDGLPVHSRGAALLMGEAHAPAAAVAVAAAVDVHRAVGGLVDLIGVPDAVKNRRRGPSPPRRPPAGHSRWSPPAHSSFPHRGPPVPERSPPCRNRTRYRGRPRPLWCR